MKQISGKIIFVRTKKNKVPKDIGYNVLQMKQRKQHKKEFIIKEEKAMPRQCPFLIEKVDLTLKHKYCTVCDKFTYDMEPDPYAEYCNNWSSGYEKCRYYQEEKRYSGGGW